MTAREAIARSQLIFTHNRSEEECILYVSQLEGKVRREVFDEAYSELTLEDADEELTMGSPYDMAYAYQIAAQVAHSNGEYERYQNIKMMADELHGDWLVYYLHRRDLGLI